MTTRYIDFKNGNDTTGTGATDAPWKTISKGQTAGANGDTLLLRGDRTDRASFHRDAFNLTISKQLTIQADGGQQPLIVGTHEYTAWTKTGGQTNVYQVAFVPATCWTCWNGDKRLVTAASVAACEAAADSFYFDDAGDLLYVNIGGAAPTSIEVYDHGNVYALILTGDPVTLDGLMFAYQFMAVDVQGNNKVIRNCAWKCWHNFSSGEGAFAGIQLGGNNNLVDSCTFDMQPQNTLSTEAWNPAISVNTAAGTVTITNIETRHAHAVQMVAGTANVSDSRFYNTPRCYGTVPCTLNISRCVFCQDVDRFLHSMIEMNGASTLTVDHSIFYRALIPTDSRYAIVLHCDGTINRIYNNVFYNFIAPNGFGHAVYLAPLGSGASTVIAKNNIFHTMRQGIAIISGTVTLDGDYNDAFNIVTYPAPGTPNGAHDSTADPKFVSLTPGAENFRLQAGSPAINAGVVVAGVTDGYQGSAPDLGAYEFRPGGKRAIRLRGRWLRVG